jgi:hypothetical protein
MQESGRRTQSSLQLTAIMTVNNRIKLNDRLRGSCSCNYALVTDVRKSDKGLAIEL